MKTYAIYEHPIELREIVKFGFSWPAFFFGLFWMIYKKLWVEAIVYFIILMLLNGSLPAASPIISLLLGLICGSAGNGWVRDSLEDRGFTQEATVDACNSDAAIAKYLRGGENNGN